MMSIKTKEQKRQMKKQNLNRVKSKKGKKNYMQNTENAN